MAIVASVKIPSDYTAEDDLNFLHILRDDQGDIHISLIERSDDSSGVRLASSGTRHSLEVRRAFYALIEAYQKEITTTRNPVIRNLNNE